MLFYLSQYALDIMFGVSWWVVKKTTDGVYYLIYNNEKNKQDKFEEEYQPVLITKEDLDSEHKLDIILNELKESRKEIDDMKILISNLEDKVKK